MFFQVTIRFFCPFLFPKNLCFFNFSSRQMFYFFHVGLDWVVFQIWVFLIKLKISDLKKVIFLRSSIKNAENCFFFKYFFLNKPIELLWWHSILLMAYMEIWIWRFQGTRYFDPAGLDLLLFQIWSCYDDNPVYWWHL